MQKFLIIMLTCLLSFPVLAQEASLLTPEEKTLLEKDLSGVVRGFIWGVPPSVISENEKGTFIDEENGSLFYLDYIRGIRCTIGYEFEDNQLWRVRIFVEKEYSDPQKRIRDLMVIRSDLKARYGEPISEEFKWLDDKDKDWPDRWGWTVYRGALFISIKWKMDDSDIELKLGAPEAYDPQMSITYENNPVKVAKEHRLKQDLLKAP